MCFPVKFFLGVLACYVVINMMFAVILFIIYGIQHPLKKGDGEDVHIWMEDDSAHVLVGVTTLMWIAMLVTDVLLLLGLFRYSRVVVRVESSEEIRPLLQKVQV
jgi:hypothetical protein